MSGPPRPMALRTDLQRLAAVGRPARYVLLGLGLLLAAALAVALLQAGGSHAPRDDATRRAARTFLATYVRSDGRVARIDQGGDTVSEGQAYGMLIAQVAGDGAAFDRIWGWTARHLRRPDGLLAYLVQDGRVRDATPASDADVLAAWALARTGAHAREARALAQSVLARETTERGGRLVLTAGPWATGQPATLNPSYWAPPAFAELARLTGEPRWSALERSSLDLTATLSAAGQALPPDWARVDGTEPVPSPAPNGQAPEVRYGLDAQRLVVWLAASCDVRARALAARWWRVLSRPGRASAIALSPSGDVIDPQTNAMPLVAAAAAAGAAGDRGARDRLLDRATRTQSAHPTYYGAAWLALGRALLTTRTLGGCGGDAA